MVSLKPYDAAKNWYSWLVNCLSLSLMTSSGMPYSAKQDLRPEITSLEAVAGKACIHGYLE